MWDGQLDNAWSWGVAVFVLAALVSDLQHDIRRIVRGRNVVLVGISAWYLLEGIKLSPELLTYDQETYNFSVFCVFLSAAFFLVGYHFIRPTRLFDPIAQTFSQLDHPALLWRVVFFCFVVGFAPIAFYSGMEIVDLLKGVLGMRETWGDSIGRGRYGGFREALLMLSNFINGASPFAVILMIKPQTNVFRKCICGTVAFWPILVAYGSGTRSTLLTALLPVLAVVYFKSSPRWQKRMLIGGLVCIPTIYYLMAAIVGSRNSGEFNWESGNQVTYVGNEMLQELAYITRNVPEKVDFQLGHNYYVQLVNPIPRFLWPGKPTLDTGILLAQLKGAVDATGEATMTNSPGLIGEMYLNFGIAGIIVLSFFGGWVVRGWDRLIQMHQSSLCTMIFYMMGLGTLFILGRSFTMSMFYAMLFLYVAVWAVTKVFRPKYSSLNRTMSPPAPFLY